MKTVPIGCPMLCLETSQRVQIKPFKVEVCPRSSTAAVEAGFARGPPTEVMDATLDARAAKLRLWAGRAWDTSSISLGGGRLPSKATIREQMGVFGRERGGALLSGVTATVQCADSRSLQLCSGLCALGRRGSKQSTS